MSVIARKRKQPAEVDTYPVSFADWLADRPGQSIASYTVVADAGITVTHSRSGAVVNLTVAGGTNNTAYRITVTVTTTPGGLVREADIAVTVKADAESAIVAWRDMVPPLTPYLPDCPVFTIEDSIKQVAREFYRTTRAWREDELTLATTVMGQALYDVFVGPPDADLVGLPAIWLADEEVDELGPGDASEPGSSADTWKVGVASASQIRLQPAPKATGQVIRGTAAFAPSDDALGLPADLYRAHREAIEKAALAELMEHASKPWSNPQQATNHQREADRLALRDSTMAGRSSRRARIRVTPA